VTRRQLPAYSPLTLRGIGGAALDAMRSPAGAREALRAHLSERFGAEHVCLTGSGTEALRLALEIASAARGGAGGLVALPAYSCYDVITAAVGAGVRATFYDIDPVSLAPDMASLAEAVHAGATAVVAGNLVAFPVDWTRVRALCEQAGAVLVEDAAQGLGSGWGGAEAGTFGDLTVLSFGRGKGWTGGGGGALLARGRLEGSDARALERVTARLVRPAAGTRAALVSGLQWALGRPSLYGLATALPGTGLGETRYKEPAPASEIPAFCAAAALRHSDAARELAEVRRENARRWDALLGEIDAASRGLERCVPLPGGASGYLRYPLLAGSSGEVDLLVARAGTAGAARSYPKALPDLPEAAPLTRVPGRDVPGARRLAGGLLTLPTHGMVTERDVERVRGAT
jgi:perosamine synthetase